MSADAVMMETLLRIEHKLDLLLSKISDAGQLQKVGSITHKCPVCASQVSYTVDINDSVVIRKCGCSTGKIALDLKSFAPPVNPARKIDNVGRDEQEDGSDPGSSTRRSKWR